MFHVKHRRIGVHSRTVHIEEPDMTTKSANIPAIDATITGRVLTLAFANGGKIVVDADRLTADIFTQATMHGLKQKLVDAAAISRNTDTGRAASVEDKYNAVFEVYERLMAGEWNKRREGAGAQSGGLLFSALCRMYEGKKTPDAVREYLDAKTDAEKAALRKNSKVAAMIETIRAERAKDGGTDGEDLLAELDA
jgi:frataxin-like iron-binding protein CyaY